MADFKNAFANSVSNSSATTVYTAPASKTSILLELDLSNKTGSDVTVDVTITDNSNSDTASTLGNDLPIPAGGTLKVVEGQKRKVNADKRKAKVADVKLMTSTSLFPELFTIFCPESIADSIELFSWS